MYSITLYGCKYRIGMLGVLIVCSLSFLLPEGVEGRNKPTVDEQATEYDLPKGHDPALERGNGRKTQLRERNWSGEYDPTIQEKKFRRVRASDRIKSRGDNVTRGHGENSSDPVVTLVFTSTLKGGSLSGESFPQQGQRNYFGEEEFSLAATRDIFIQTQWKQLQGEHIQRVHIYSPDGNLFQKRVVPFAITENLKRKRLKVSGITNMIDVQKARPMKDGQAVVVQFPISGTWVSQHSMLGTWRVEAFLDQESSPIGTGTFTLIE